MSSFEDAARREFMEAYFRAQRDLVLALMAGYFAVRDRMTPEAADAQWMLLEIASNDVSKREAEWKKSLDG